MSIITNDTEENAYERKLQHLERNPITPATTFNQISEFCQQIVSEIDQNNIMTITQLNSILKTPNYIHIPDIVNELLNVSYELENEFEMAESCLSKVSQNTNVADFFKACILSRCHNEKTQHFILDECLKHTDDPNYSNIFSLCIDANPSEHMWPFVLRMKKGFAESSMNLLFQGIFPPSKKLVIQKMKEQPSREDMLLLSLLQLTKEEFIEENVAQIALNQLQLSILPPVADDGLVKMSDTLKFIGNKMIEFGTYFPEFANIAINLIKEGNLYQAQESVKFLYCILPLLPIESLIQDNTIEKICDLINSESTSSSIESSLVLLLMCFQKFPEETSKLIDYEYLTSSLYLVDEKDDSFHEIIQQIFDIFTPTE